MGRLKYLLDTNILSEPARQIPNTKVMDKFQQYDGQFATSSTVWHELLYGVTVLPNSKKKMQLQGYLNMLRDNGLIIIPYDVAAATWLAEQRATLKSQGKTAAYVDGEIAAVAAVNSLTLVTRNTDDFKYFEHLALDNWFE